MTANMPSAEDVLFRGKKITRDYSEQVINMDISMGMSAVTELTIAIEDPMLKNLEKFKIGTPVTYRNLRLIVSVIETSEAGGIGGITVRCRPQVVNKLKKLRGTKVMSNVSPTQFFNSELKLVKGKYFSQSSPTRTNVSRDTPEKGTTYDETSYPSAWTTISRFADELGYAMYEADGIVYFGKPSYIVKTKPKVVVTWYGDDGTEPLAVPEFRESVDSEDVEVSVILPLSRAEECKPGHGLVIKGFPKYSGTYMITDVSYPLIGDGVVSVSASTVRNPEPQDVMGEGYGSAGANSAFDESWSWKPPKGFDAWLEDMYGLEPKKSTHQQMVERKLRGSGVLPQKYVKTNWWDIF